MKFKFSIDAINKAAKLLQTIQTNSADSGVRYVVIKADGKSVRLSSVGKAVSADIWLSSDQASIDFTDPISIDFKKVFDLSKSIGEDLSGEIKDGWAFCKMGKSRFRIPAMAEAISPVSDIESAKPFVKNVGAYWLKSALHAASIAVAKLDHGNLGLRGIHVFTKNGSLVVESCDGSELVQTSTECKVLKEIDIIVVQQSISTILQALAARESEEPAEIYFESNKFIVRFQDLVIKAGTQAGEFPQVGKLIKEKSEFTVQLDRDQIMPILKRAAMFSASAFTKLKISKDLLEIKAQDSYGGEFEESCEVQFPHERSFDLNVKINNLIGCFNEMSEKKLTIRFDSDPKAIFATAITDEFNFVYMTALERAETK